PGDDHSLDDVHAHRGTVETDADRDGLLVGSWPRQARLHPARAVQDVLDRGGGSLSVGLRRQANLVGLLRGDGTAQQRGEWECEEEASRRAVHSVWSISSSVEDRGSSFTGLHVMSSNTAKKTSSSTTPSWFVSLNPRSPPFAPRP